MHPNERPNTIKLDEYRVVFFLVAKAANSSVKAAIKKKQGRSTAPDGLHSGWERVWPCEARRLWDYYKVAIVRNPWDRVVSCYYQKILQGGKAGFLSIEGFYRGMSFDGFVNMVCSMPDVKEAHLRDQHMHMICEGELVPEWVIKFEKLDRSWPKVQKIIPLPELEVRNKSDHPPYQECYTKTQRNMIAKRYAKDIELFDYEF